jgi:ATP-dependent Clp protease ATP-binding subunit ClpA
MAGHEGDPARDDRLKKELTEALRRTFRPEFLNRIDEIVTFRSLGKDEIVKIVDIQLADLQNRLAARKLTLELSPGARKALADAGYDAVFGARPLKRTIQRMIENPLAVDVLAGRFVEGDTVVVEPDGDTLRFRKAVAAEVAS